MVLIGYWPLNETDTSDSTAYDHSGNENHGNVTGAGPAGTGTTNGPLNTTAYQFDGSDDKITLNNDWKRFSTGNTYSMWLKMDFTDQRDIIGDDDRGWSWHRIHPSDGTYETIDGSGNTLTVSNIGFKTNEWMMFTVKWEEKTEDVVIYINGREESRADASSYGSFGYVDTIAYANNSGYFKGAISEYRYYNRALTPRELQYLYTTSQRGRMVSSKKSS